jgi:hypothetical protein
MPDGVGEYGARWSVDPHRIMAKEGTARQRMPAPIDRSIEALLQRARCVDEPAAAPVWVEARLSFPPRDRPRHDRQKLRRASEERRSGAPIGPSIDPSDDLGCAACAITSSSPYEASITTA